MCHRVNIVYLRETGTCTCMNIKSVLFVWCVLLLADDPVPFLLAKILQWLQEECAEDEEAAKEKVQHLGYQCTQPVSSCVDVFDCESKFSGRFNFFWLLTCCYEA